MKVKIIKTGKIVDLPTNVIDTLIEKGTGVIRLETEEVKKPNVLKSK
jgi:hypothetical protein